MQRRLPLVLATFLTFACGGCEQAVDRASAAEGQNLLTNPGFEQGGAPIPDGWSFEKKASGKGEIGLDSEHARSGRYALVMSPNRKNGGGQIASDPLGIGQGFEAGKIRGRTVHVGGYLGAEGGATAVAGFYVLGGPGGVTFLELRQPDSQGELIYQEDSLQVPDSGGIAFGVLNLHPESDSGKVYFDDLYVGFERPLAQAGDESSATGPLAATIVVDATKTIRRIPPTLFGTNVEWIWDGNGLIDAASGRLDADVVRLAQQAGVSLLRFPGGGFADFYDWRNGVGPREDRATTQHLPAAPSSKHNLGTNEVLELSRLLNAPLLITGNIVTASPRDNVEWLRYLRERTGPGKAPTIRYWELGNEQYVGKGSPHSDAATMTPRQYGTKFLEYAQALREADDEIQIGAILDENYGRAIPHSYANWTEVVLPMVKDEADFVAIHNGYAPLVLNPEGRTMREVYEAMLAAPTLIGRHLENLTERLKRAGAPDDLFIAVTEWGPFFHLTPESPYVDHVKTLGSALYAAAVLKRYIESPRVEVANFFKLNDLLFMGWIAKRDGRFVANAPLYALQMYTRHFGDELVASTVTTPTYPSRRVGWVDAVPDAPYLDVIASRKGDRLFVMAINKHFDQDIPAEITLQGVRPAGRPILTQLTGSGIDANTGTELFQAPGVSWARQAEDQQNPRFRKGGPDEIAMSSDTYKAVDSSFSFSFPKHSITSLEIPVH